MIEKMWDILTTFTEASQKAALEKCTELGFDTNRGIVSLDESFINLNSTRQILVDAIERKKLIQLPITVQNVLFTHLEAISRSITNLLNGADEIVNLTNYIEQLNSAIWQYGLHNLSDQVLGYLEKMNQLKNQEIEIARLTRDLESTLAQKQTLENLLNNAKQSLENINGITTQAEELAKKAADNLEATNQASQNAAVFLTNIQQNDSTATQLLATTKTSTAEVTALEPKIKEFYTQIDTYRTKIDATSSQVQEIIIVNKKATDELLAELQQLEDQIKVQIQKATGFSLFHSFQTRQIELASSKRFWVWAIVALVITSLCISIYVIKTTTNIDVAFYVKLSMSLPLIYAIAFCTVQYGRERKLEEEYAFKSNISISLVPYQELVEKIVNNSQTGEREKFTAFIIDAITKVYTSPTDKIFDGENRQKNPSPDALNQLEKCIEALVKPLEPLLKALKH